MLNKSQKIAKNEAKYRWRYEAFDKWILTHSAPPSEKSTFTQLSKRTMPFGEKIAKRLCDEYGIPGIFIDGERGQLPQNTLNHQIQTEYENELLDLFRKISDPVAKGQVIGFAKGIIEKQKNMPDLSIPKKPKKAAA